VGFKIDLTCEAGASCLNQRPYTREIRRRTEARRPFPFPLFNIPDLPFSPSALSALNPPGPSDFERDLRMFLAGASGAGPSPSLFLAVFG